MIKFDEKLTIQVLHMYYTIRTDFLIHILIIRTGNLEYNERIFQAPIFNRKKV